MYKTMYLVHCESVTFIISTVCTGRVLFRWLAADSPEQFCDWLPRFRTTPCNSRNASPQDQETLTSRSSWRHCIRNYYVNCSNKLWYCCLIVVFLNARSFCVFFLTWFSFHCFLLCHSFLYLCDKLPSGADQYSKWRGAVHTIQSRSSS